MALKKDDFPTTKTFFFCFFDECPDKFVNTYWYEPVKIESKSSLKKENDAIGCVLINPNYFTFIFKKWVIQMIINLST